MWPPLTATAKEQPGEQVDEVGLNPIPQQYQVPRYIAWPDSNPHLRRISSNKIYNDLLHEDSIRLLEIEAGEGESPVFCHLHLARLHQDCPSYESLSYVWGNNFQRVDIICNGIKLEVTQNLRDALQRLRLKTCSRLIWVDAICIDQGNSPERGQQVEMMSSIYKVAKRVIVWLGPGIKDTTPKALSVICSIVNNWHYQIHGTRPATFVSLGCSTTSCDEIPSTEDLESWWPVRQMFNLPWFWRLWVIQEVVLSPSALVIWGDSEISWKWIGLAASLIRSNHYQFLQRFRTTGVYNAYFMYRISTGRDAITPLSVTFYQLLGLTRQFEVTEPRDRIFALLGLPTSDADPGEGRLFIKPDYTLPVKVLYKNVARQILLQSGSLDILSSVQNSSRRRLHSPSWVPDWNRVSTHALNPLSPERHTADLGVRVQLIDSKNLDILVTKGIEVDVISEALPPMQGGNLSALVRNTGLLRRYLQTETGIRLLSRTLTAGKDWYGTLVTNSDRHTADFAAYLLQPTNPRDDFFVGKYRYTLPKDELIRLCRQILSYYGWQSLWHAVLGLVRDSLSATVERLQGPWQINQLQTPDLRVLAQHGDADRFLQAASTACTGRRLFFTAGGAMGLGPEAMMEGDFVCVLFGGSIPFVLRSTHDHYQLVGECYVEGLMRGEAVDRWRSGKLMEKTFHLH